MGPLVGFTKLCDEYSIEIYGPIFSKPAQIIKELDLSDGGNRNRGGRD